MALPPVKIPVQIEKEGAIGAVRETEAFHRAAVDRMDEKTRASFAKTKAAAESLARDLRRGGATDALMGGNPGAGSEAAVTRTARATQDLWRQTENLDRGWKQFFRSSQRGMVALSAGIGAATAAAAGSERSFLALGTTILSAFAAGGPVAGGLAIIAGAIGWMVGETKDAEKAAKAAAAAHQEWLAGVTSSASKAAEEVARLNDETAVALARAGGSTTASVSVFAAERIRNEAKDAALRAAGNVTRFQTASVRRTPEEEIAAARAYGPGFAQQYTDPHRVEAAKKLAEAVIALDAAEKMLAATYANEDAKEQERATEDIRRRNEALKTSTQALRDEISVLRERTEIERELRGLMQDRDAKLKAGLPAEDVEAAFRLKVKEAVRTEGTRYASDAASARREAERWWANLVDEIQRADDAQASLLAKSDDFLANIEREILVAAALTDQEKDRLETEIAIANALDAGTLAVSDATVAYERLLELAKLRRAAEERKRTEAEQKRKTEEEAREAERVAKARADATDDVQKQLRLLRATSEIERAILEIEDKIAEYRKAGVSESLLTDLRSEMVKQALAEGKGQGAVEKWMREIEPTISSGLAGIIADGITTGFENAGDLARQLWSQLLNQLLNDLISSGLKAAIGGLFSSAGGGIGGGGIGGVLGMVLPGLTGGNTAGAIASGAAGIGGCDG